MHKCKLTNQERIAAVKEYLDGHGSYATIARKYGIVRTTLREAVNLYLSQGEHALYTTSKNTHYSPELKRQAVEAYLSGEGSQQDICNRFHIRSKSQLRDWIRLYNGHNEFRSYTGHRSDIYMTKGRNTTLEERIEIVSFCMGTPGWRRDHCDSDESVRSVLEGFSGGSAYVLRTGRTA